MDDYYDFRISEMPVGVPVMRIGLNEGYYWHTGIEVDSISEAALEDCWSGDGGNEMPIHQFTMSVEDNTASGDGLWLCVMQNQTSANIPVAEHGIFRMSIPMSTARRLRDALTLVIRARSEGI